MSVKIENVVVTAFLNNPLNLEAVKKAVPGKWSQPKRFLGLVYKVKRPAVALLMFKTGRIVCTGARSEAEAERVLRKLCRKLVEKGFMVGEPRITVQNVVVSTELGMKVDLEGAAGSFKGAVYEPERFPGLICKMGGASLLVFSTGKVVCVGAKSAEKAYALIREFKEHLAKV
jgi:transcription initiation factor TFIID TATA-box-binding protein